MEEYFTQKDDKSFPQFRELGEDIMMHILSFVAEAPFEDLRGKGVKSFISPLTHSLPLVSKQFHRLMKNESFWKAALVRQLRREPRLWHGGLKNLDSDNQQVTSQQEEEEDVTQILERFEGRTDCSELYRSVLNTQIRHKGPIFCMNQNLQLGEPYGLHFFEPRYRTLIAEVLQPFPESARQGDPIEVPPGHAPPIFIHAHTYPLRQGSPAVLVQVIRCRIYPQDGRADVFLLPIAFIRMEFMWERPGSGHLYYGQCIRVGMEENRELDRRSAEPAIFGQP